VLFVPPAAVQVRAQPADAALDGAALAQTDPGAVERGIGRLRADLHSGRWHEKHRDLLGLDEWDAGFRLIVSRG